MSQRLFRPVWSPKVAKTSGKVAFQTHNHAICVSDAIKQVEKLCREQSLRLTPVRRRVLEILLEEHKALGAYDLLDRLNAENLGSQPPVVYRALDFLMSNGFVHKLQRLNAYVACGHLNDAHTPVFMICQSCNSVAEADIGENLGPIDKAADAVGFSIEHQVIEADGLCPACQPSNERP